jgi:parallel beta-helix repeat protein
MGISGRGVDATNGSDGNVFEGLDSSGNRTGIAITSSAGNTIRTSVLDDNSATGALIFTASRTKVLANRISGNAFNGVAFVEGSSENQAVGNDVRGSETGLIIDSSSRNLFSLNRVSGAGDGILVAGDGNTVAGNLVDGSVGGCDGCSGYGIGVLSGAGNALTANVVQRSASDGINVAAAGTSLQLNVALHNAGWAIDAVPGVRDLGGNRGERCANVSCSQRGRPPGSRPDRTPPRSAHRSAGGRRGHR